MSLIIFGPRSKTLLYCGKGHTQADLKDTLESYIYALLYEFDQSYNFKHVCCPKILIFV